LSNRHTLSAICLLTLLAFGFCLSANSALAQTNNAESELPAANNAIGQAFNAIKAAEKAGANVTDLIVELNGAAELLTSAENSREPDIVAAQADSILSISQDVKTAALEAKQTAIVSNQNAFLSNILLSIISALVFILALFLIWRRLKKRYTQNLLNAKPQVVELWSKTVTR
jgi:CHASE3 domain sensor protein